VSVSLQDPASPPTSLPTWRGAGLVLAVAVAIVLLAMTAGFAAAAVFDVWAHADEPRAFAAGETTALLTARVSASLGAFQGVTMLLVLASNARLPAGHSLLRFDMPAGGLRTIAIAVLILLAAAGLYGGLIYTFDRWALEHDMATFAELMKSRNWWLLVLVAAVGAPVAEECLFRGLLYGTLRQSPLGAIGAAVVTAFMWAMLHTSYSIYGILAIMLIGLYLAYVRERTGSLQTPMICHCAYNSAIALSLAFLPDGIFSLPG
jgi:membrane protease YdiL (CAAX protease family)